MIMALEPRVMFDGAAVATLAEQAVDKTGTQGGSDVVVAPATVPSAPTPAAHKEVAFVDASVSASDVLASGLRPGIEVVMLDGAADGLAQMADWASTHQGYDAIHILSHGAEGAVELGSAVLDLAAIETRQAELAAIATALSADGDILLYGCDVAKDSAGLAFLGALSNGTGADIAASDNVTGQSGDWVLEQSVGTVETSVAVADATKTAYQSDLVFVTADYGASNEIYGDSITDADGNTYVTGGYNGAAQKFQGITLPAVAGYDGYLAKIDATGTVLWAKGFATAGGDIGYTLALDKDTNQVYCYNALGAAVNGMPSGATITVWSANGDYLRYIKYHQLSSSTNNVTGMAVAGGYLYVTGNMQNTQDFDAGAATVARTPVGSNDIFLAKYTTAGQLVWVDTLGSAGWDNSGQLAVDAAGNVYVTGTFAGACDFDPSAKSVTLTPNNNNKTDAFLAKYDANGALAWVNQIGGTNADTITAVVVDGNGNVTVGGSFSGTNADFDPGPGTAIKASSGTTSDAYLAQYNASNGSYNWVYTFGMPTAIDTVSDIALSSDGSLLVTGAAGSYSKTVDFDPSSATVSPTNNVGCGFVAKYTVGGALTWVRGYAAQGSNTAKIAADGSDRIYLSSSYLTSGGGTDFDPGAKFGTLLPTISGSYNAYAVVQYQSDGWMSTPNTLPTFTSTTGLTVDENATATDIRALVAASDVDAGQTLTWAFSALHGTITASAGANPTATSGGTSILPSGTVTYTPNAGYVGTDTISCVLADNVLVYGQQATRSITVTVNNVAPIITPNQVLSVNENSAAGTVVGTVALTGDTNGHTYSLSSGSAYFTINSAGQIAVATGGAGLNYETRAQIPITVNVHDDVTGAIVTGDLTVNIADVNEAPVLIGTWATGTLNVVENATPVFIGYYVQIRDPDFGQTLTWSIVSGPSKGTLAGFPATTSSGPLMTPTGVTYQPTANAVGADSFVIQISDGTLTTTRTVNVVIGNTLPAASMSAVAGGVAENASIGTVVGTASSSGDANGLSYSIVGGNTGNVFAINATTGQVTVASALDYETLSSYSLTIRVTDESGATANGTMAVAVTDVAEGPANSVPAAQTLTEDGTLVLSKANGNGLVVSDSQNSPSLTTTLSVGAGKGVLTVTSGSGATVTGDGTNSVQIQGTADQINSALARVVYAPTANGSGSGYATLTMDTTNGSVSDSKTVTLNVTAVADTPSITNATTKQEVQSASGLVLSRNGADGAEVGYYRITGITGGTLYKNDGTTVIANDTFITAAEGAAGLKFTPSANSTATGSFLAQAATSADVSGLGGDPIKATITVTPVDKGPVLTLSSGSVAFVEDSGSVYVDAGLSLTDVDGGTIPSARVSIGGFVAGDTLTWTNSGGITGSYDGGTGVLTLSGNATADQYQQVLRSVKFSASGDAPTLADRSIQIVLGSSVNYLASSGHWYEVVNSSGITWDAAKTAAESRTLMGMTGYLATITSSAENALLGGLISSEAWLGGSDATSEGVWKWVGGPEAGQQFWQGGAAGSAVGGAYVNWGVTMPDNAWGGQNYMWLRSTGAQWDDARPNEDAVVAAVGGGTSYYIVEYGGMTGDPTLTASRTMTVTAVNDAPVNTLASTSVSVNEDATLTFSAGNGNAITVSDPDGNVSLRTTLSVNSGVLTLGSTSNITVTGNGSGEVVVTGTAANINTALSGMTYTGRLNFNGVDKLTVLTSDQGNSGSGGALTANGIVSITVNPVNDAPSFTALGGDVTSDVTVRDRNTEVVLLDANAGLADVDLDAGSWSGGTLTLARQGGANAVDVFGATGTLALSGGNVVLGGTTIGTYDLTSTPGRLVITFGSAANAASVDQTIRQITYGYNAIAANQSDVVTIAYSLDDGNSGGQGSGGALTASGSVKVKLDKVYVAPQFDSVPAAKTVAEDGSLSFSGDSFTFHDDNGSASVITENVTLTVSNGALSLGSTTGLSGLSGVGTATLSFSGKNADIQAAMSSLTYSPTANFNGVDSLTMVVANPTANDLSASSSVKITVSAVNDAPTFSGLSGSVSAREQTSALLAAESLLADVDLDAANWSGAVLTLARQGGADASDSFTATGTLSLAAGTVSLGGTNVGSYTNAGGTLAITFGANATADRVDQVLQQISYTNTSDAPPSSVVIAYGINDGNSAAGQGTGGALTASGSVTVNITAINDAPVVTVPGARSVNEDTGLSLSGLGVADADSSANAVDVTLKVANGTLSLASLSGLTVTSGSNGSAAMVLHGTAADINTALGGLTYQGRTDFNGSDQLVVSVTDNGNSGVGTSLSDTKTVDITVNAVNDAPTLTVLADTSATEQGGSINPLKYVDVADVDAVYSTSQLTVSLDSYRAGDTLSVGGILGVTYNSGTGAVSYGGTQVATAAGGNGQALVINFNGSADAVSVNMVTKAVTYATTGDNPTNYGANPTRTLTASFSDGALAASRSSTLTISAVNDKPVVSATTTTATFTESGAGGTAVALLAGVSLTDADGQSLNGGSVTVKLDSYRSGDILAISAGNGITVASGTVSYNGSAIGTVSGGDGADLVISLTSANATPAATQALLGQVTFANTGDNPSLNGTDLKRIVTFVVDDGGNTGASSDSKAQLQSVVSIVAENDRPTVAASSGSVVFIAGGSAVVVDSGLTLADLDNNTLTRAEISIGAAPNGASESLSLTAVAQSAATASGLTVTAYNAGTLKLVITGTADLAKYQDVLRGVQYANSAGTPDNTARSISFVVRDASADGATQDSTAASRSVSFNLLPTVASTGMTVQEGASDTTITTAMLRVSDTETSATASLVYTVTTLPTGGTLMKDGVPVILGNTFTQADVDANKITYTHLGGEAASDSFGFSYTDSTSTVTGGSFAITVTNVNDAPVMATASPTLASITEDQLTPAGTLVSALLGASVTDPDAGSVQGLAVVQSGGNGTWQFSTDGGTTYTAFASYSVDTALLLRSTDKVRFIPDGQNATTGTLTYYAWDRTSGTAGNTAAIVSGITCAFSGSANTATIAVTAVNDAPASADGSLAAIDEDNVSSSGATVSSLVGTGFTDIDSGASLGGIAITGNTANATTEGVWQYSTNGTNWFAIGAVGDNATALALSTSSSLRFVPVANYNGTPTGLSYRVIDNSFGGTWTSGSTRATTDASANGGTSALGSTARSISTSVNAVNDVPTVTGTATPSIWDSATATPFSAVTIADVESQTLVVIIDLPSNNQGDISDPSGTGIAGAKQLTFIGTGAEVTAAIRQVVYTPRANSGPPGSQDQEVMTITVVDAQSGSTISQDTVVSITGLNDPTVTSATIADHQAVNTVDYSIPANAFIDPDPQVISYTVTLADGRPLPSWLRFDSNTLRFSGTIPVGTFTHAIKIVATDGTTNAQQTFTLNSSRSPEPVSAPPPPTAGATLPIGPQGDKAAGQGGGETGTAPLQTVVRDTTKSDKPIGLQTVVRENSAPSGFTPASLVSTAPRGDAAPQAAQTAFAPVLTAPTATSFQVVVAAKAAGAPDALVVNAPVRDTVIAEGNRIAVTIPADSFASTKADATVTLAATQLNGAALPAWMAFNPQTGTFEGQPPPGFQGVVEVRVVARDNEGREAVQTFKIVVGEAGQGNVAPAGG
ncbi:DUF4347 domain-containing protein, partial [Paramagnetospirillum marisnigri]|uniref:DUF4347 domain-containing protein n=1 Tax=Paramagnetospirillum marisnigri TaxID=1285242 RepID=UPI0008396B73